ncbi:FH1/FH2 domain-containing protein 3 [Varanus komodoensis]|nr:FH1/FH2 domain-containing protein 3 [Varanus komodoensis]
MSQLSQRTATPVTPAKTLSWSAIGIPSETLPWSPALFVDFEQLRDNLCQMEKRCKASWDHLKAIAKHEMKSTLKQKMSEFLKDCAERIIILKIVHRRIINRFHSFLLFMGYPPYAIRDVNINKFCKIVSEFALEYRTTRERVLQQKQKRANHRERNKTRGKMITDGYRIEFDALPPLGHIQATPPSPGLMAEVEALLSKGAIECVFLDLHRGFYCYYMVSKWDGNLRLMLDPMKFRMTTLQGILPLLRQRICKSSPTWSTGSWRPPPHPRDDLLGLHSTCNLLQDLGLLINYDKSVLSPTQSILFRGAHLDSISARAFLPEPQAETLILLATAVRIMAHSTAHTIQRLLGLMAAKVLVLQLTCLQMRSLLLWFMEAFAVNEDFHTTIQPLPPVVRQTLQWWSTIDNLTTRVAFFPPEHSITIMTDALNTGGVAHCVDMRLQGLQNPHESCLHINHLKMLECSKPSPPS